MNYVSIASLSNVIRSRLSDIPSDVDLVVGVPRSGVLPASMIALGLNVHYCDLGCLLADGALLHGGTRDVRYKHIRKPSDAMHVLVVDDSVSTGQSIGTLRKELGATESLGRYTFLAVYTTQEGSSQVDRYLELLKLPRVFEWNLFHRPFLEECCVDIDGVLCVDPLERENDDADNYAKFLKTAKPIVMPSHKVGHLVSSRLEKYRALTEEWLFDQRIAYGELHLLDLPDAVTRQKENAHARFKASVYCRIQSAKLFIESEPNQARDIARLSGKYVLCFPSQQMYSPGITYKSVLEKKYSLTRRLVRKCKRLSRVV